MYPILMAQQHGPSPMLISILIPLGIGAAVLIAVMGYRTNQQRIARMTALADQLGLTFYREAPFIIEDRFPQFSAFRRGRGRRGEMTLVGTLDLGGLACDVCAGDYRYRVTTGSGKNRRTQTRRFSYVITTLPFAYTPDLVIRGENMLDKIAGIFTDTDIDFESEAFSRRFHVSSPDRKFAYDLIDPRMMNFLMAELDDRSRGGPGAVELRLGKAMLSNGIGRWRPENFEAAIGFMARFISNWPDHLVTRLSSNGR